MGMRKKQEVFIQKDLVMVCGVNEFYEEKFGNTWIDVLDARATLHGHLGRERVARNPKKKSSRQADMGC